MNPLFHSFHGKTAKLPACLRVTHAASPNNNKFLAHGKNIHVYRGMSGINGLTACFYWNSSWKAVETNFHRYATNH